MSEKKQKLELTWIGKDKRPRLVPRGLAEDAAMSYNATARKHFLNGAGNFIRPLRLFVRVTCARRVNIQIHT